MSITFALNVVADSIAKPATITARQLAAFRAFARARGELLDIEDDDPILACSFEARVCPWALASICAIFDHDEAVIAVVEEAQFRGLNIRIWQDDATRSIRMVVASTPDGSTEMNLANANAYAVLETIGLGDDCCGEVALDDLSSRLADPTIRDAMTRSGLHGYLSRLDGLAQCGIENEEVRMVWG